MGTRGLIGIRVDGKYFGVYNHFDSYLSGLGVTIIEFIHKLNEKKKWKQFKENVRKIELVSLDTTPSKELKAKYLKYTDLDVSSQSLNDWYCLLRDTQNGIWLNEVFKGDLEHVIDGSDFILDSLFCEYAYILDLDNCKLEFYRGFQRVKQKNNPFGTGRLEKEWEDGTKHKSEYYPCKLITKIKFKDINRHTIEILEKLVEKEYEMRGKKGI